MSRLFTLQALKAAFEAGQRSVGYRDEQMSRIDMTSDRYVDLLISKGECEKCGAVRALFNVCDRCYNSDRSE